LTIPLGNSSGLFGPLVSKIDLHIFTEFSFINYITRSSFDKIFTLIYHDLNK